MKPTNYHSRLKYTAFLLLGSWWALALLLATIQVYNTLRSPLVLLIGCAVSLLVLYLHYMLVTQVLKKNKTAQLIAYAYAGIHFIPLIAQFLTLKEPGPDNLVTALMGCVLVGVLFRREGRKTQSTR